jgi:hypothetical protein
MYEVIISSRDIREHLKKINHTFTDFELATIIYNMVTPISRCHDMLTELAKNTEDSALRSQIEQRMSIDLKAFEDFKNNAGFIYALMPNSECGGGAEAYFLNVDAAVECGKVLNQNCRKDCSEGSNKRCDERAFSVEKHIAYDEFNNSLLKDDYIKSAVACLVYDKEGNVTEYWTNDSVQADNTRFEDAFVNIPHPFKKGDIVRIVGTNNFGVVESLLENEDIKRFNDSLDWTDCSVMVEFLSDKGDFYHNHINPLLLEKAFLPKFDERKHILQAAAALLLGQISLDFYTVCYEEYRRKLSK